MVERIPLKVSSCAEFCKVKAEQGGAQSNLGLMYAQGRGTPQDYVMAHMCVNAAVSGNVKESSFACPIAGISISMSIKNARIEFFRFIMPLNHPV